MQAVRRPLCGIAGVFLLSAAAAIGAADEALAAKDPQEAAANSTSEKKPLAAQIEVAARFIETTDTTILRLDPKTAGVDSLRRAVRGGPEESVLTSAELSELIAALNTARGVDTLSAPRVITRVGQRAVIEVINELRYATKWDRDEEKGLWIPTTYETRNCGVTLDVEPTIDEAGAITLTLTAQGVQFLGWRDLDAEEAASRAGANRAGKRGRRATRAPVADHSGKHRLQAVFSSRKRETKVVMEEGKTLLLASLPETEEVQPFSSPAGKRRLIVTISPRLVNPDVKEVAAVPAR